MAYLALPSFRGSRRVTVSGVTAGITSPRQSGQVPYFLQASASPTTATGSSHPYMDGEFRWSVEVSDGLGGWDDYAPTHRNFDHPVETGVTVNPYTDQVGPEFVCPFDEAGTYRITLTARFYDGASGYVTDTATEDHTVTDFAADANGHGSTHLYYSASGSDSNDGKDPWLLGLTGATYNATTNRVAKVGGFTNYDHAAATASTDPLRHYNYLYFNAGLGTAPALWLKELPASGTFATWPDSSGNGHDATAVTATAPTTTTVNGRHYATEGCYSVADFAIGNSFTVAYYNTWNNTRTHFSKSLNNGTSEVSFHVSGSATGFTVRITQNGTTTDKSYTYNTATKAGVIIFSFDANTGVLTTRYRGVTLTPDSTASDDAMTGLYDSSRALAISGYLDGSAVPVDQTNTVQIYEFQLYTSALSLGAREAIEGYMCHKLGVTSHLPSDHPYKTLQPVSGLFLNRLAKVAAKISNDEIELEPGFWPDNLTALSTGGGAKQTMPSTTTVDTRCRFIAGTTSTTAVSLLSNSRLDCYGAGTAPTITTTTSSLLIVNGSGGTPATKTDVAVSSITCVRVVGATTVDALLAVTGQNLTTGKINYVYFDRCDCVSASGYSQQQIAMANVILADLSDSNTGIGFWDCDAINPASGSNGAKQGIYFDCGPWGFVVGGTISGYGTSAVLDHHIYPNIRTHALFKWINFGLGTGRNYCINGNWDKGVATYWLVSECNIYGTLRAIDFGDADNDPVNNYFENCVVDACPAHGLSGDAQFLQSNCKSRTHRDIRGWSNTGGRFISMMEGGSGFGSAGFCNVERVFAYVAASDHTTYVIEYMATLSAAGTASIKDCKIHDLRTAAKTIDVTFAGGTFSGNNLYAPNDADGNIVLRNAVAYTLATYISGLDATGSGTLPDWNDPAAGDFRAGYPPDISTSTAFSVNERQTAAGTMAATGDAPITWAITGGADAALFAIVEATGVLTFLVAPVYASPTDANADNIYVVQVTATNAEGSDAVTLNITVSRNSTRPNMGGNRHSVGRR